jgi:hypothetical protein
MKCANAVGPFLRQSRPRIHTNKHEMRLVRGDSCDFVDRSHSSRAYPERRSGVAPPAVLEIQIAAKCSAAVMTAGAGIVSGGKVFLRARRTHLPPLRKPSRVVMTICAIESLTRGVLRVTKTNPVGGRI